MPAVAFIGLGLLASFTDVFGGTTAFAGAGGGGAGARAFAFFFQLSMSSNKLGFGWDGIGCLSADGCPLGSLAIAASKFSGNGSAGSGAVSAVFCNAASNACVVDKLSTVSDGRGAAGCVVERSCGIVADCVARLG